MSVGADAAGASDAAPDSYAARVAEDLTASSAKLYRTRDLVRPDVTAALAELRRVLRPGGRVVVWDVDWSTVSWHSSDPARMDRVLQAWDEHLAHPCLPRTLAAQLRSVGFDDIRMAGHAFATTALDPDSYAATVLHFVTRFVTGRRPHLGRRRGLVG